MVVSEPIKNPSVAAKVAMPLPENRAHLSTERRLAESEDLDRLGTYAALALMSEQDRVAVEAVAAERDAVAQAVEMVTGALRLGGRLIYVGAGTSGRLGALDAFECPPTFGAPPSQVVGIVADDSDMSIATEGAEDRPDAGAAALDREKVAPGDVVLGISAGGTARFVHGAMCHARTLGARTIFLCCVEPTPAEPPAHLYIRPLTGPEVLTGSTRLKAGTATKLVLNQITTLVMVELGKAYGNLMVDLIATNSKLWDRGARIVSELTGLSREDAIVQLQQAEGNVKIAIVMHMKQFDLPEARKQLARFDGSLRQAIEDGLVAD